MNQLLFNDYMITQAFQDMFSTCFRSKSKYFDLKKEVTEKKNITVSVPFFYRPSLSNTKKRLIFLSRFPLCLSFSLFAVNGNSWGGSAFDKETKLSPP